MDRFLWYIYIHVDSHTPICLDRNQITHWDSFLHSFLLTLQITHVKSLLPEMLHFHKGNQELISLASRARINILHSNKLIPILSSFLSIPPSGLEKSKMEQEGKPESYPWSAHVPAGSCCPDTSFLPATPAHGDKGQGDKSYLGFDLWLHTGEFQTEAKVLYKHPPPLVARQSS